MWNICTHPTNPTILIAVGDSIPSGYTVEAQTSNPNYLADTTVVPVAANPTTLAGYGITDAFVPLTESKYPHGFVDRFQCTISYVDGTRTFTVAPVAASFEYYHTGVRVSKTAPESIVFANTSGLWFFHYLTGGVLATSMGPWNLETQIPIAAVCWDAVNSRVITFADERHGDNMDWTTHRYLHLTQGTKFGGGFDLGNYSTIGLGTLNTDCQLSLANGKIHDEDLYISIMHSATPTNPYEQVLSTIAQLPVLRRNSNGTSNWVEDAATNYPLKTGANRIQYNLNTAGTWSSVDASVDSNFVAMWIFATNGLTKPVVAILGQREDASLFAAKAYNTYESCVFDQLPFPESKILYRLIFQTSSLFTNTPKAALVDVTDMRTTTVGIAAVAPFVGAGKVLQVMSGSIAQQAGTTQIPWDNTVPLITEGFPIWTQPFTPLSSTSKIVVVFAILVSGGSNNRIFSCSLYGGPTCTGVTATDGSTANVIYNLSMSQTFLSGSIATITIQARVGQNGAGTLYVNQTSGANMGGSTASDYTIMEIQQ